MKNIENKTANSPVTVNTENKDGFEFGKEALENSIKEKINAELAPIKSKYERGYLKLLFIKEECCKFLAVKYNLTASFFGWNGEYFNLEDIFDDDVPIGEVYSWEEIREAFNKDSPDIHYIETDAIFTFWKNIFYEVLKNIISKIKNPKEVLNKYHEFMESHYYAEYIYEYCTWKDVKEYCRNELLEGSDEFLEDSGDYDQDYYYIFKQFWNHYLTLEPLAGQIDRIENDIEEIKKQLQNDESQWKLSGSELTTLFKKEVGLRTELAELKSQLKLKDKS